MNNLKVGDNVQYVAGGYISQKLGRVVDAVLTAGYNEYVVKWENEGTVDTVTYPSQYLRKV